MDNIREKLVELLNRVQDSGQKTTYEEHSINVCVRRNEDIADHLLANGVTIQEWIPVTGRLPDYYSDHVLINVLGDKPFATVHEAYLRKDGLWVTGLYRYDKEDVTHWMPLPQPHKGE